MLRVIRHKECWPLKFLLISRHSHKNSYISRNINAVGQVTPENCVMSHSRVYIGQTGESYSFLWHYGSNSSVTAQQAQHNSDINWSMCFVNNQNKKRSAWNVSNVPVVIVTNIYINFVTSFSPKFSVMTYFFNV